jgi:SAM-dependent methyltransferase
VPKLNPIGFAWLAMGVTCALCKSPGPMQALYPGVALDRCPACGLVFYRELNTVDPLAIYSRDYFHGAEYQDYRSSRAALQKTFRLRIRELVKYHSGGRLFEIGAAYGFFLDLAQKHWQVRGIDIAPDAVNYAREELKLAVEAGDFLDLPDEEGKYEIICMWDTIEHLVNPMAYLEKAARWLAPGGIIALTTGDIESLVARTQKEHWRLIHPPSHLFYFSRRTMHQALEQCGLTVRHASHVGYYRGVKAMLHGLFGSSPSKRPWLVRLLAMGGSKDIPVYLNLYDILFAVAQKPMER